MDNWFVSNDMLSCEINMLSKVKWYDLDIEELKNSLTKGERQDNVNCISFPNKIPAVVSDDSMMISIARKKIESYLHCYVRP